MVTTRSWLTAALLTGAALALPTPAAAHPGGFGPGGMGGGGFIPGQSWYPAAAIRSVGRGWNYNLNVSPGDWDGGYAAYQQGYYAALQQAQLLAQQRPRQAAPAPQRGARPATPPWPRPSAPAAQTPPAERAAAKLKLARLLAENGQPADAAEYYAAIVKDYPGTPAAAAAQTFLAPGQAGAPGQ
jgi:hypothetical protein